MAREPELLSPSPRILSGVLALLASFAIALPTLIAFNIAPSATFFNQAAAFVGWGGFFLALAGAMPKREWPHAPGTLAMLAALAIVCLAALGASAFAQAPWSLSLSAVGTVLSAILALVVGAAAQRDGFGGRAFHAFCVALVVAGIASSLIGLVQVFAPGLPDGDWVAISAIPGRATGNVRQPNHLSSLLLWSIVAAVWLGETKPVYRKLAIALVVGFIYVIVLSASRTGAVGMLTLAAWGCFDRRLSPRARALLVLSPLIYGACWWGTTLWATQSHHLFGGQTRFGGSGDISSSRFGIWSNTLSLIAMHPWLGVGFGEFNFAWSLTPFPGRPVAFFDHTHNILLNFLVELGIPLAVLVTSLMSFALWRALQNAIADGRRLPAEESPDTIGQGSQVSIQRAAFVVVIMVAVHSMLEYPLWYSYFLLPTAFAFGLCLESRRASVVELEAGPRLSGTRPLVLASMALILGGSLAVWDYMQVAIIFAPPADAGPLEQRVARGRRSVLFAHHADYAAATIAEHPGRVMSAFERAPHYLLDARLLMAWANALNENGEIDKARYIARRLKEFRNDQAESFFAPCNGAQLDASADLPFQCQPPGKTFTFSDFK